MALVRRFLAVAALLVSAPLLARASVGPLEQTGIFALLGGTPKIVSKFWAEHGSGLSATLKIRQFTMDGKTPILRYTIDMQKLMHLVVIRDDFATFDHLHPAFDAQTGIFSAPFTKNANHRFFVYADSMPKGIGQQVFRFTIESDGPLAPAKPSLTASPVTSKAGPYAVTLAKTTLAANVPLKLDVTVRRGGAPAQDLVPYLGAAAHCVLIDTATLAYVHVHPHERGHAMAMSSGTDMPMGGIAADARVGANQQLELPALPAGTYKAWYQFKGVGERTYAAAFTLVAR